MVRKKLNSINNTIYDKGQAQKSNSKGKVANELINICMISDIIC